MPGNMEKRRVYILELHEEMDEIGGVSIVSRLAETYSAGAAYEEAIPYYEEMLQENTSPDTLFGAAFAYYQSGKAERAVTPSGSAHRNGSRLFFRLYARWPIVFFDGGRPQSL